MHYTRDNMAGLLRSHDINPTHQRIEIAHALFSRHEHLSADQVMTIVNTDRKSTRLNSSHRLTSRMPSSA
jgi:Fur family iron response transcriptional regulator